MEEEAQNELLARIQCSDFVREIVNLPSSLITPQELAQRAADFIVHQAEEYSDKSAVDFRIVFADALREQNYQGIWQVGKGSANPPAMAN